MSQRQVITVVVRIVGEFDDLAQLEKVQYSDSLTSLIESASLQMRFVGTSNRHPQWWTTCWIFDMHRERREWFESELIKVRGDRPMLDVVIGDAVWL